MSIASLGSYPQSRMRLGVHRLEDRTRHAPICELAAAITTAVDLLDREGRLPACIAEWSELELSEARRVVEAGEDAGMTQQILATVLGALGACRAGKEANDGRNW